MQQHTFHYFAYLMTPHWICLQKCIYLCCNYRVLQIKDLIKDCLRQKDIEVTIEPTTREEPAAPPVLKRSACADASTFSPLRKMVSRRQRPDKGGVIITTQTDEFGTQEQVQVTPLPPHQDTQTYTHRDTFHPTC